MAILLLLTILYCVRLNGQLRLLKADEQSLRATISELVTATEIAERAIAGLKATVREGEQTLGERLQRAEGLSAEIDASSAPARSCLSKLSPHRRVSMRAAEAAGRRRPMPARWRRRRKPSPNARARRLGDCGMIRLARDFRLIPIVLHRDDLPVRAQGLGLIFDGGYTSASACRTTTS